jgi:hypothetical protein
MPSVSKQTIKQKLSLPEPVWLQNTHGLISGTLAYFRTRRIFFQSARKGKSHLLSSSGNMKYEKPYGEAKEEGWSVVSVVMMGANASSSVIVAIVLKALFLSYCSIPIAGLVAFQLSCTLIFTSTLYFFGWFDIPPINCVFLIMHSAAQVEFSCSQHLRVLLYGRSSLSAS